MFEFLIMPVTAIIVLIASDRLRRYLLKPVPREQAQREYEDRLKEIDRDFQDRAGR